MLLAYRLVPKLSPPGLSLKGGRGLTLNRVSQTLCLVPKRRLPNKRARPLELREEFARLDEDASGLISVDELRDELCLGTRMTKEQARSLAKGVVAKYDADGNGELDLEEFIAYSTRSRHYPSGPLRLRRRSRPKVTPQPRQQQACDAGLATASDLSGVAGTFARTMRCFFRCRNVQYLGKPYEGSQLIADCA